MNLPAPAKINIGLRLLCRRDDGYHEIETFLHTMVWGDDIQIEPSDGISLEVRPAADAPRPESFDKIPSDSFNLAWQAAEAVIEAAGLPGVSIFIEKRIPVGSGLGGGSSDAATVLKGTLQLYGARLEPEELQRVALELGADVSFFLEGGFALAEGVGEKLTPIEPAQGTPIVLALPPASVSTRWAYMAANCTLTRPGRYREYLLYDRELIELCSREELSNDLQKAAVDAHPEIAAHLAALNDSGTCFTSMTGSGSAVYGLFDSEKDAAEAARKLAADGFCSVRSVLQ